MYIPRPCLLEVNEVSPWSLGNSQTKSLYIENLKGQGFISYLDPGLKRKQTGSLHGVVGLERRFCKNICFICGKREGRLRADSLASVKLRVLDMQVKDLKEL